MVSKNKSTKVCKSKNCSKNQAKRPIEQIKEQLFDHMIWMRSPNLDTIYQDGFLW